MNGRRTAPRLRLGERRLILLIGDLVAASAATFLALAGWSQFDWLELSAEFLRVRAQWFVFLPLVWVLLMVNLYDIHRAASWRETGTGVMKAAGIGGFIYLVAYFTLAGSLARRGVLYFLVLTVVFTLAWRRLYISIFRTPAFSRRVLVVGAGDSSRTLLQAVASLAAAPFQVVGLIDDDRDKVGSVVEGFSVRGGNRDLLRLVESEEATEIIVAILGPMNGEMLQAVLDAQQRGVEITRMPVAYEELLGRLPIQHLESDWLLRSFVDEMRVSALYLMAKRLMDFAGALMGMLVVLLVFPTVALAILIESRRPVLFLQSRLGQGGRPIRVVKFRTMRQEAEADGQAHWAREGDPRTTRVGRILRRMHLDEFPQFWNVMKGDMSLVGPRPERPELVADLEREIPFYRARLLVKPGITGWAQVNYGKGASVQGSAEKLEYDLYYIKHRSVLLDLWIILRTVGNVLGFRGV
jgi:exopolysaccharide biosynthesis polyprenyl glycosylphosphotransferase